MKRVNINENGILIIKQLFFKKRHIKKCKLQNRNSKAGHHPCSYPSKESGYQPWTLPLLNLHQIIPQHIFPPKNIPNLYQTYYYSLSCLVYCYCDTFLSFYYWQYFSSSNP